MKSRLWEPFQMRQMELRNRIVMPPMVTRYGSEEGYVTERTRNYYEARAQGGAGLIIIEATYIHPVGQSFANQLGISDDRFIPGMTELVQAIHKHGAKAAVQLIHGGREASSQLTRMQLVAPSRLPGSSGEMPRELTVDEIAQTAAFFAEAALRVKKAGFDGVEIHGAHGYLIDQFLSRSANKRQDAYGGDLRHRARFLVEVIKAVKVAVGEKYPVWCRINGRQYGVEGGATLEEAQETARMAQNAGADAIHVTAYGPTSPVNFTTAIFRPAILEDLAEGIKKAISVPVIAVGRFTPEAGERILEQGKADLIAIGKGLLADPELPRKVAAGKLEDINPCILCMGCRDSLRSTTVVGIQCHVNPVLGREGEYKIVPAKKSKRVLVVGGGPAGMEAARVAALRGHQVTLYEKEDRLGGQLVQAAIPPHKDRIKALVRYFETQVKKLGVKVVLGKEATATLVKQLKPDVVILSTGVTPFTPEIPGLNKANVVQARDILESEVEVGNNVVVIGGELVGCETAEFLAEKGKKVTVTRRGPEMASKMAPAVRTFLLDRLSASGVTLLTRVRYNKVTPQGLVLTTDDGETKTIKADSIVLAAGAIPNRKLLEELKGEVPEIHLVGDCVEPRTIRDAIVDGFHIALKI